MLMKTYGKNILLRVFLASSIIILFLSAGNNIAQAKNDSIQYNNKVFTKKLYKNTAKITFRYTDAKSKKMIKKVYVLLAKMKLEGKELALLLLLSKQKIIKRKNLYFKVMRCMLVQKNILSRKIIL